MKNTSKITTKNSTIPKYSLSEELISAISHGIGALLSVAALVLTIVAAAKHHNPIAVVSSAIYGTMLIILYTMSTLYHSFKPTCKAKKVFRIFDHCSIFLLIFGSYTPFVLVALQGALGWTIFGIILAATILGITLNAIDLKKYKVFLLYLNRVIVLYFLLFCQDCLSISAILNLIYYIFSCQAACFMIY